MTVDFNDKATTTGWDESIARAWLDGGVNENEYLPAWRLAALVAAEDTALESQVVLDVASGPGGFLAVALELMPKAKGIWLDTFATMESAARTHLVDFEDRVEYKVGDLLELDQAAAPESVSLVVCSRATHHLEGDALNDFYAQAFRVLQPGGWLANLDQTVAPGEWGPRLSKARRQLSPSFGVRVPGHPQAHPHSLDDHLRGAERAGFVEAYPIWRFCQHVLVMARKPAE